MAVVHNVPCNQGPACWTCFKVYWSSVYALLPEKMKQWNEHHKDKKRGSPNTV